MRRALLGCVVATGLLPSPAWCHGTSQSFMEARVRDQRIEVTVRFDAHDVVGSPSVSSDMQVNLPNGVHCTADPQRVASVGEPAEEFRVDVTFRCPQIIRDFEVVAQLLPELEPPHVTMATFSGLGLDTTHVFAVTSSSVRLRVRAPLVQPGPNVACWGAGIFALLSLVALVGRFLARSRGP